MGHKKSFLVLVSLTKGIIIISRWNASVEVVEVSKVQGFFIALWVFTLAFHPLTSLLGSFSIPLSEDGDEGTEPCEGLYLNVRVSSFGLGIAARAASPSKSQNPVCNRAGSSVQWRLNLICAY